MKLSPKQIELLVAMRSGVVVHYMSGLATYYFRCDTMAHCTATVEALIRRGLAERYAADWRGAKVRATGVPQTEPTPVGITENDAEQTGRKPA